MKPWWVAFLFACASEPKPAPVAPPPAAQPTPVAPSEPEADDGNHATAEASPSTADLLTGEGPSTDVDMTKRRPGADLGAQIRDAQQGGKSVSVGGGTSGGQPASPGTVDHRNVGRISVLEKQAFDNTTLTAELVVAKIQATYVMGIKRCYREYLKKDPTAKGELVLNLTVDENGRTSAGTAKGVATDIGDCATAQMAAWRFPIPKNASGEATTAAFRIKLALAPE